MELAFTIGIVLHATLGGLCLLSGAVAMATRKAPGKHPLAGRIFAVSLVLAYLAILFNVVMKQNLFMLGIGGFAAYAGIDGWRSLRRYKGVLAPTMQPADMAFIGLLGLLTLVLASFGVRLLVGGNGMGWICVAFAVLGGALIRGSVTRLRGDIPRPQWLVAHIGLMSGAFGAALTALAAVQLEGLLGGFDWVIWVAPTVVMGFFARTQEKRMGLR